MGGKWECTSKLQCNRADLTGGGGGGRGRGAAAAAAIAALRATRKREASRAAGGKGVCQAFLEPSPPDHAADALQMVVESVGHLALLGLQHSTGRHNRGSRGGCPSRTAAAPLGSNASPWRGGMLCCARRWPAGAAAVCAAHRCGGAVCERALLRHALLLNVSEFHHAREKGCHLRAAEVIRSEQEQQAEPSQEGEAAGREGQAAGGRRLAAAAAGRTGRLEWSAPCAHLVRALRVSPGPAWVHPNGCAAFPHFGSAYPKAPARLPMVTPLIPSSSYRREQNRTPLPSNACRCCCRGVVWCGVVAGL